MGVLYILDEPSIGLHQRDNDKLLGTLKQLRDLGNTLIVVEHDEDTMRAADYIVDVGPGAGVHGGEIVAQGTVQDIMALPKLHHRAVSLRRQKASRCPKSAAEPNGLADCAGRAGEQPEKHRRVHSRWACLLLRHRRFRLGQDPLWSTRFSISTWPRS